MAEASTGYVTVLFECKAKPGKENELREVLTGLVTPSRFEAGCISYDFHTVEGDPRSFIAYERWVSRAALDAHLQTPPLKNLAQHSADLIEGTLEGGLRFLHALRPSPK